MAPLFNSEHKTRRCFVPREKHIRFAHYFAGVGIEPTTSRLCIPLRFPSSPKSFWSLWSGLYLHPFSIYEKLGCLPSSLYTFPKNFRAWLGITLFRGFTEFDRLTIIRYQTMSPFEPCEQPLLIPAMTKTALNQLLQTSQTVD